METELSFSKNSEKINDSLCRLDVVLAGVDCLYDYLVFGYYSTKLVDNN